jgi:hypothetical protein
VLLGSLCHPGYVVAPGIRRISSRRQHDPPAAPHGPDRSTLPSVHQAARRLMMGCPHKPHKNAVRGQPEVKANAEGRSRVSGWLLLCREQS